MSNNREINFKFAADTKAAETGAQTLADALNKMQNRAGKAVENIEILQKDLMQSNDRMTAAAVSLGGSEEQLEAFCARMDDAISKLGELGEAYQKTASQAYDLAKAVQGSGDAEASKPQSQALGAEYKALEARMKALSAEARTLTRDMDAARTALQEGALSPAQAQTVAALNAEMEKAVTLLRRMKDSGSSVIIDADGGMHGVHDLTLTLQKAKEAKEALLEGGDLTNRLQQYGNDSADAVNKILESYEKLKKTEDKRAEQEAKAAARAEAQAEKKIERIDEQTAREAASIEDLTAKQKELAEAREKAKADGNAVNEAKYAEALKKTTAEIEKKTRAQDRAAAAAEKEAAAQEKAAQKTAAASEKAGASFTASVSGMIRAAAMGTLTMRGLAASIRAIGTAIKTGLGPIGWMVIAIEALIWAAQAAWGWVKKLWEDNTKAAKEAAEKQQKILDDAIAAAEEARKRYDGFIAEQKEKDALNALESSLKSIQGELDLKISKQREALALAMQEATLTQTREEAERRLARTQLEGEKIRGEITEEEYIRRKQEIEQQALVARQEHEMRTKQEKYNQGKQSNNARAVALENARIAGEPLAEIMQLLRSDEIRDIDTANLYEMAERLRKAKEDYGFDGSFGDFNNLLQQRIASAENEVKISQNLGITSRAERWQKTVDELKNKYNPVIELYAEIERIQNLNREEAETLKNYGYEDWSKILLGQTSKAGGKSTVYGHFSKENTRAQEKIATLEKDIAEAETQLALQSAEIASLREAQATDRQNLREQGLNEQVGFERKESERRKKENEARIKKEQDEEEKRIKEKLEAEARAEAVRNAYSAETDDYKGKGAKLLSIFSDGVISSSEQKSMGQLMMLAESNTKLRNILDKLLTVAEQNAQKGSSQQLYLDSLRSDLKKIEDRVNRLMRNR